MPTEPSTEREMLLLLNQQMSQLIRDVGEMSIQLKQSVERFGALDLFRQSTDTRLVRLEADTESHGKAIKDLQDDAAIWKDRMKIAGIIVAVLIIPLVLEYLKNWLIP